MIMTKKILLIFGLIYSTFSAAQTKDWVSCYEINKNRFNNEEDFSQANRIFIKQTTDSLYFFDVGKTALKNRFNRKIPYKKLGDSLLTQTPKELLFIGIEDKDTLTIYNENGNYSKWALLVDTKFKKRKIENTFLSRKFSVPPKEVYNLFFNNGEEDKIFWVLEERPKDDNVSWARLRKFDNYFFLEFYEKRSKFFQIVKIKNKHVELLAPNKSNSRAILKVIK